MKIAQIAPAALTVPPQRYGGIELIVASMADGLARRGHEVSLFASGGSVTKARLVSPFQNAPGIENMTPMLDTTHALSAYLRAEEFDIIHDHTAAGVALASVMKTSASSVHTLHGPWTPESRRFYGLIDGRVSLVAISETQKAANLSIEYGATVYNGIELETFPFQTDKQDYLLFLGRCNPEKGPELAVEIAAAAGMHLKMGVKMNEPLEKRHWEQHVAPRLTGTEEIIEDVGHEAKTRLLANARATLFPIQWDEPFGLVMAESMACGTPVLTFARGAATEIVEDGVTGYFCDDVRDMAAKVQWASNISAAACRRRVLDHFSAEKMVGGYEKLYRRLRETEQPPAREGLVFRR